MIKSVLSAVSDNNKTRATSHAKSVDLAHDQSAIDRARALNEEFKRAKAARQQSLEREKPAERGSGERITSYAKSVNMDAKESSLDRTAPLKGQFNRTQTAQEKPRPHAREQQNVPEEKRRAEPPHAPRAEPHLRLPDGPIRRAVDRQIDKEKLAKENERARQANAEYQARQRQANLNRTKDMDRDM
jgi:hypothetical protein